MGEEVEEADNITTDSDESSGRLNREESLDGQLLLEIIRNEENRDLRHLVKKFRDQCRRYLSCQRSVWTEELDRTVIDYLEDPEKAILFCIFREDHHHQHQDGQLTIQWSINNEDDEDLLSSSDVCFFLKMDDGPFLRPDQFEASFYHESYLAGSSDLGRHWNKIALNFEKQTLMIGTPYKELKHLMEVKLLKIRLDLIGNKNNLDEAFLLKPTLVPPPPSSEEDDEDRIELLERIARQWIHVCTYNLELRDYHIPVSPDSVPTIHDEIQSLVLKYDVMKKLSTKLFREEYQQVLTALKQANSVMGDEMDHLVDNLQEEARQSKLTAKYLGCLRRPLEALEKVKIHGEVFRGQQIPPLLDLPAVYQDACNRILVIAKHVPAYKNKEDQIASRLLYMFGNQVVSKICQHTREVALDQFFFKGKPRQCVQDVENICQKALKICIDIYNQTMKWHQKELKDDIVLANFKALNLRFAHLINICQSLEELGRYGDGIKAVTFSAERESDIGQSLLGAQDHFVQLSLDLIQHHREALLDIHRPDEWYTAYNRFQGETRSIEIQLVHDVEEAVNRCSTLWSIYEILMSFQHLYRRPLFTSVINSTANQLYKKASNEAKVACGITSSDPWSSPVYATLTTTSTRLATSAQRARGYVNKIAKLIQMTSWAGTLAYCEKALSRCQLAHRVLGEAIKREYIEWIDKLQLDLVYNANVALQKFAVRRHYQRPDWIQCNLDVIVFQVIQSAEGFDRLLIELPGQVSSMWQERNELRNVYGSVCAMCYYFNYIVQELTSMDKEVQRDAIAKLEKAVQPCLSQITWKQMIILKRVVSASYFAMEEVVQELLVNSLVEEP